LSQAIRSLEEELGVAIVQRGRRFLGFTPEGERILAWARHSLAALSGLRQEASAAQRHLTGLLRVGTVPTAAGVMSHLTGACRAVHPDLNYAVHSLSSSEILRRLKAYELDVALMYLDDAEAEGFHALPLYHERFMLLAAATAPVARRAELRWKDLAPLPLCLLTPDMQNRQIVNSAFRRESVNPYVVVETDSMTALLAHVRHAGLYSVVPGSLLDGMDPSGGLVWRPLEPEFSRAVGLAAMPQEPPAPLPAAVLAIAATLDIGSRLTVG
jgi:DNA-binding transcriptional LysR family regulator